MLKSLEIQGFKSFPERTEISFHKGITAIVGPNGTGKSNITDAIRWVLGEQSAKTLRGQRMEDVIFSGTAQRRPVSFSEVTLTLDNSKHILPIDYETVSITRRYYRSGDSEYLINKTPCRLKDITTLLMDTGIGLDGYSIIGQGRIDDILSNRSEDRRAIFEEASGIVQYRARKRESLKRLDRSEQNLLRVDDLLTELYDQSTSLEKQANDARSHIDLATQFRKLDTALTLRQIGNFELQRAKREDDAGIIHADLELARSELCDLRAAHAAAVSLIDDLEHQVEREQNRFNEQSVAKTKCMGLDALYKEKYAGSKKGAETLLEEKNRLTMQVMAAEHELTGRGNRRNELVERRDTSVRELGEAGSALEEMNAALDIYNRQIETAVAERESLTDRLSALRASYQEKVGESQALRARTDRLEKEKQALEQESAESVETLDKLHKELEDLEDAIGIDESLADQAHKNTQGGHLIADDIEKSMDGTAHQIRQLTYEADTLERLESGYEGYHRPVQLLMQQLKKTPQQGVYGPLGSLLSIPDTLALALETSLGATTHHIVCDNPDTAERWIDWLHTSRSGRVTFLPTGSLNVRALDERTLATASQSGGWIGIASELVECEERAKPALEFVLGRTLIVETLEDAIALSKALGRSHTVVSLSGDIVHRGGSMTGGYWASKSSGILGRPSRIRAIRREIQTKQEEYRELADELDHAKDALREAASEEEKILDRLATSRRYLVRMTAEEQALATAHERLARDLETLRVESDMIVSRIQQLESEMARDKQDSINADSKRIEIVSEISILESDHREKLRTRDAFRSETTKFEFSIASLDEAIAEFDAMSAVSSKEIDASGTRLKAIAREWEDQTARMEQARTDIADNEKKLVCVTQQLKDSEELLKQLMEQREDSSAKQRKLLEDMNDANDRVASLYAVNERQTAELDRVSQQIDDQLNKLWETHGLTRKEAEDEAEAIDSVSRSTSERAELKQRIDQLGPINHNAIKDYESLKARIDFMSSQREDIEEARIELEGIVRELDKSMREQFNATFKEINRNFNQVFEELFSGGQAEILLEGESDVLEADISIQAQPPGKKLQKLSLLSGGERSLTAIALLFAILKLKPAPFCVFDEVESALDDANVKRFTDYVRRYAWSMQFILVTHRKGTMEASDRLYGVTMQERGISRVISMVLSSALALQ